ncbi:MAG: hypothetical protein WBH14_11665, partial [Albidovulum sp.]
MTSTDLSRPNNRLALPSTRALGWLGFYATVLVAWIAVAFMARDLPGADLGSVPAEFWAALCLSAGQADPLALWAMWALMTAAMMLPTFV